MADRIGTRNRTADAPPRTGEQPLPVGIAAVPDPGRRVPPARPEVAGAVALPAAGEGRAARPRSVRLVAALWCAGALAAVLGIAAALAEHGELERDLTATALERDPSRAADVIADGVQATIVVVLGGTGLLLALTLVWVALLLRRRGWARWALLGTALPLLLALDVTQDMVSGGATLDRAAVLAAAVLVVAALAVLPARSARAWFRPAGEQPPAAAAVPAAGPRVPAARRASARE